MSTNASSVQILSQVPLLANDCLKINCQLVMHGNNELNVRIERICTSEDVPVTTYMMNMPVEVLRSLKDNIKSLFATWVGAESLVSAERATQTHAHDEAAKYKRTRKRRRTPKKTDVKPTSDVNIDVETA